MVNSRKEITLRDLKAALESLSKEIDDLLSDPSQVADGEKVFCSELSEYFEDKIYVILSPYFEEDGGGEEVLPDSWDMDLFLTGLQVKLEDKEKEEPLDLALAIPDLANIFRLSAEINACQFISAEGYGALYPVTLNCNSYDDIKFIGNNSMRSEIKIQIAAASYSITDYSSNVTISDNVVGKLTIQYNKEDTHRTPSYCGTTFERNKISDFLYIAISRDSFGKLRFSFKSNSVKALALSYPIKKASEEFIETEGMFESDLPIDSLREQALQNDYWGRHRLSMDSNNNIEEIYLAGRFPEITRWGFSDRVGDSILNQYDKSIKGWGKKASETVLWGVKVIDKEREEAKGRIEVNRYVFNFYKNIAIKDNRRILEQVMNYNIAKMDGMLLKIDGWPWWDRLISLAGLWLSRHGTSWIRPIAWIAGVGLVFAFIITWALGNFYSWDGSKYGAVLVELLHPIGYPNNTLAVGSLNANELSLPSFIVSGILFFLFKAFYAICVYMFYRSATRFTVK